MLIFVAGMAFGQQAKGRLDVTAVPVPSWHYLEEYTLDKPTDIAAWSAQKPGLNVAFGSTDNRYLRCEVPMLSEGSDTWKDTGWKGERLNAQMVLWSPDTIEQIRVTAGDLVNANGDVISKENIKTSLIRYVLSNFPYNASEFSCEVSNDSAWLMPDRFEPFERFDLPGNTVRPVWISINIPSGAQPGHYNGQIVVNSLENNVTLNVSIQVQHMVLPDPHDWKFRLDLWQNPWVIAWYYHVEPWSEEHKMLLKQHLKIYAEAGGTYITTYALHSPWSDNSYMIEGTMIDWIKTSRNDWKYDYTIFDQYVELAMEMGIDRAITVYTPLPWGNRFRYLDEKTGNYIYEIWEPTSEIYKSSWNSFLTDLKEHLMQKGWFEKTYLGINENALEYTMAAINIIKEHSRDWKITYAGNWHAELSALLDDYSPVIESEGSPAEMKERTARGQTTTYYVCCTPPKPNNFVFSPPAESRFIGWYAKAYGYDGFLRWAYDAWPADPVRDARHTLWPAGDCYLVYPGGNSSIRFEKLREGIVDYEKIRLLKEVTPKSEDKRVKSLVEELNTHLNNLASEREYKNRNYDQEFITGSLQKGKTLIRDISDALGK